MRFIFLFFCFFYLCVMHVGCAYGDRGAGNGVTFIFQDPVFWLIFIVVAFSAVVSGISSLFNKEDD